MDGLVTYPYSKKNDTVGPIFARKLHPWFWYTDGNNNDKGSDYDYDDNVMVYPG